jgi:oxepin-CoA hydrolase / 3-oxo-5,6-dehydrosuberyl-CoA semialdehyde dehydrogenase
MTAKAGQKCTAIRRAFVPAARIDEVAEAARERLAAVTVGNPASHQPRRDGRGCGHPGPLVVRRGVVGVQQPDAGDQCPVGVGGADPGLGLGGAVAQLPGAGAEARPRPGPFPPAGHEQVPRHSADRRTPA